MIQTLTMVRKLRMIETNMLKIIHTIKGGYGFLIVQYQVIAREGRFSRSACSHAHARLSNLLFISIHRHAIVM